MREPLTKILRSLKGLPADQAPAPEVMQALRSRIDGWPADDPLGDALRAATWDAPSLDAAALLGLIDPREEGARWLDGWDPEVPSVDRAVLGALGLPMGPDVASAVAAQAGSIDLTPGLGVDLLGIAWPVGVAVSARAGSVDLVDEVVAAVSDPDLSLSAMLDAAVSGEARQAVSERLARDPAARRRMRVWAGMGRALREAVRPGAGEVPDLWETVARAVGVEDPQEVAGWDERLLSREIPAAAGEVEVTAAVMSRIAADTSGVAVAPSLPAPANNARWWQAAAVLVAAGLLIWVVPRLPLGPSDDGAGGFVEQEVRFATADEVSVEQIRSGNSASIFVEMPSDEGGPVIIWVDEEGRL